MRSDSHTHKVAIAALALGLSMFGCTGGGPASDAASDTSTAPASTAAAPVERTVPAGTALTVEFMDSVSSETAQVGDTFAVRVLDPVQIDGVEAVESGDLVIGTVVSAVPTKKIGGKASLELSFDTLRRSSGDDVAVAAYLVEEGKKQTKKDAATIGGITAGGAILGRIIGHQDGKRDDGTKVGAVVGAAVGTAIAATNETDPVEIPSGTVVILRLDAPLTVSVS